MWARITNLRSRYIYIYNARDSIKEEKQMLLILILVSMIIGLIEGIPLVQQKMWRELATITVIIIIAVFLGIVKILGMPTPIHILKDLLSPLGKAIFKHP